MRFMQRKNDNPWTTVPTMAHRMSTPIPADSADPRKERRGVTPPCRWMVVG
jgi:hypothetical protein